MSQPFEAGHAGEPGGQARDRRGGLLLLAALLGLCVLARFVELGRWGLWIDEAFTLTDLRAAVEGREAWPANPLGYWLVAAWLRLAGAETELALRLVPALFGAAALPLCYWAFRPCSGTRTALLAALFVGANTWALYWAQNARFYSIALALATLGLGCFSRALFQADPRGAPGEARTRIAFAWLLAALASFAVAALAHPSALLFGAALGCAPIVLWLVRIRPGATFGRVTLGLLVAGLAALLVALPWASQLWQRYQESKSSPSPLHFVLTTGYHVTPWLALAAAWGLRAAWRERAAYGAWIATASVATLTALLLLSLQARVSAQYVFVALPAFAWLAAHGLSDLAVSRRALASTLLAAMLLASFADQAHYFLARNGDRERWREAYQFVWNHRGQDDLIVGMAGPVGEYYLAPDSRSFRQPLALVPLTTHNAFVTLQWARRERRIWYVVLDEWLEEWPADERARLGSFLDESGRLMAEFPVRHPIRDLTVRVWLVE